MIAEIINIGDELLIGQVINTNASWIAENFNHYGISIARVTIIPDERTSILHAIKAAEELADIIIITGGLGPTNDDITKKVLCEYFDTPLVFNDRIYTDIQTFFKARGLQVTELNRSQAEIPSCSQPIRNLNGTAPGMWFEKNQKIIISLPGVPFEMKPMISNDILPSVAQRFSLPVILHKTILTHGIGESFLADKISSWESSLPNNIKLAYLPSPGLVKLRLTAKGNDRNMLSKLINEKVLTLQKIISDYIYGFDNDTMEEIIGQLLKEKNKTVSTAESCTGGYIAHRIISVPGSSSYYKGSIICYANEIKIQELNVPAQTIQKHGAVSEETVCRMALGIREKFGTDYSIAVSGIAGPDGGSVEKPVGTVWIAVAGSEKVSSHLVQLGDNRERNIQRASITALNLLRKILLQEAS